jgi:DNA-binding MarR family transcriptional regulator
MSSPTVRGNKAAITPISRDQSIMRDLAQFRYALRKFLRFSENAARQCGVTPQQHQLMLGVQGFTGRGSATISELAEFLQERHHSVVGLIERAEQHGLVRRTQDTTDRRVVNVTLTPTGQKVLLELSKMHFEEAKRMRGLWTMYEPPSASRSTKSKLP